MEILYALGLIATLYLGSVWVDCNDYQYTECGKAGYTKEQCDSPMLRHEVTQGRCE